MSIVCHEVRDMARSEVNRVYVDWGENTAAEKTGALGAGDTVASCVVTVDAKPTGSTDPTLGAVTVPSNASSDDINGRVWSTGEATVCTVTMGATQDYGEYRLKLVATTANGYTIPRYVRINVKSPA